MNSSTTAHFVRFTARIRRLGVLAAWCLVALLLWTNVRWSLPRGHNLKDFGSFVAAGRAAAEGRDPYGPDPLVFHVWTRNLEVDSPNLNPPLSVLLFEPLAHVSPERAFRVWYLLSLGMAGAILILMVRLFPALRSPARIAWLVSLGGLWHILELGQIYLPLVLCTIAAWLALRARQPVLAGALAGAVIALKPNLAVWPLLLAAGGGWSFAVTAGGTSIALSLLPLLRYGPEIYARWLHTLPQAAIALPGNGSLAAVTARLGVPHLATPVAGVLILALLVWVWRRRPPLIPLSGVAVTASLLAAPVAWPGYTLLLLPALAGTRWTAPIRAGALLLTVPPWLVFEHANRSQVGWVVAGSLYSMALIVLLVGFIRAAGRQASGTITPLTLDARAA